MLGMNAALRSSFLLRLCKQRELTKLKNALSRLLDLNYGASKYTNMYKELATLI